MQIILTHENADFDAIASLLAAWKLNPAAIPILPERQNRNVAHFLALYQTGLPFVRQADFHSRSVDQIILVDTQRPPPVRGVKKDTPVHIVDHHPPADLPAHFTFSGEIIGAATTLLVEQIQQQSLPLLPMEATLLALGIYEDTGSLVYRDTTPRDLRAAAWLVEQQADLTIVRQFIAPGDREQTEARVADLMSYGVQTVDADRHIGEVVRQLRRIGHEGFPVVENGRLVGLLTRRDLDRAVEHGLGSLTVRDIMSVGQIAMKPADPVSSLEQRMVDSGWGQIPVVDEADKLVGVVTRTDLIKYWARTHPARRTPETILTPQDIEGVLGKPVARLIERVAQQAQDLGLGLYMVGGSVRDLLLRRSNLDIDFVVEGDAIAFANHLQKQLGGKVSPYLPFGTATWTPPDADGLPDHLDFATARNEFYEHPTALPTVYGGSIKLDLLRRDFTINTLAVQVSPAALMGRVLDFYGGLNDLQAGMIRALHSLSFVDDPTRILRAVRFEHRLGFQIEPRTAELIQTALPMLRRITGERLRNEMALLLREREPERALLALQSRGALEAIHPAFKVDDQLPEHFERGRSLKLPWPMEAPDPVDLNWSIIACGIPVKLLADWCQRLLFGRTMSESLVDAARLTQESDGLRQIRPSQVAARLDGVSELALLTGWLIIEDSAIREYIRRYRVEWRHVRASTTGHTLRARGLKPGPCYRLILERLRTARLDGEVSGDAEEERLLRALIDGGFCDEVVQTRT